MMVLSDWCQFAFEDGLFRIFSPPSHLQLLDGPSTIVLPLAVVLLLASLAQNIEPYSPLEAVKIMSGFSELVAIAVTQPE
jgi:hypothetical protein